jgi:hypothetical protein
VNAAFCLQCLVQGVGNPVHAEKMTAGETSMRDAMARNAKSRAR